MNYFFILLVIASQYLLSEPVQLSIKDAQFEPLREVLEKKVAVNFEAPLELNGYISADKFIEDLERMFRGYETVNLEESSQQVDDNFCCQSLNVMLRNKRSEQIFYYKFVLFMKKGKEWKIYYIKGLRL